MTTTPHIARDVDGDNHTEHDASRDVMPGDPAPGFAASASTGRELSLGDFLGKVPVALTFAGGLSTAATDELIDAFDEVFPQFGRRRVQTLVVVSQSPEAVRRRRRTGTNVPLLADAAGELVEVYAASAAYPTTVLIDESGMVTRLVEGGVAADHAAAVLGVSNDAHEHGRPHERSNEE